MQDKSEPSPAPCFPLPGHRVVELAGRDAAGFAQAQFMNDVAGLADGEWQWSGWLTPKGRIVALFALLRLEEGLFRLLLPDADAMAFADALRRFFFRSKVTVRVLDDIRVLGRHAAPVEANGHVLAPVPGGVELDMGGDGGARTLVIAAGPVPDADPAAGGDAAAVERDQAAWTLADLRHGLPRLPPGDPQWTPQQLSLERLSAFSVRKGCYPGQEIVARTHFLGKAKRQLVLLEGTVQAPAGTPVTLDGETAGEVVSSAPAPEGRHVALAVVRTADPAPGAYELQGGSAQVRAFAGGLARPRG